MRKQLGSQNLVALIIESVVLLSVPEWFLFWFYPASSASSPVRV
jgi:hypothetical protein